MSDVQFINCTAVDRILPGDKYRITVEQSDVQRFIWGDEILSVYQKMSTIPWGYVVTEPPLNNAPVMVVDMRISRSTVGSAPPGAVSDLYNSLADLLLFSSAKYMVTVVEKLSTSAPIEDRGKALEAAVTAQGETGLTGLAKDLKGFGGGLKTVVIAGAVIVGAVALIYIAKEIRAARAA